MQIANMSAPIHDGGDRPESAREFSTTHWSVVIRAGGEASPEADQALEALCRSYWRPLYEYICRKGYSGHDAEDLVQAFFEQRFLKQNYLRIADPNRGRFRTFLLTSLQNFLKNEWVKANSLKRGNGQTPLALNEELDEVGPSSPPAANESPELCYDRAWAAAVLDRALAALRRQKELAGKLDSFDRLKVFVWGEQSGLSYAAMAAQLGMTEGALKVEVHRLRHDFGELLRAEIGQTVSTPAEVDEELRYLRSVIRNELTNSNNFGPENL
jgi:RNA polymerase sigma factor (sigma-70 family)